MIEVYWGHPVHIIVTEAGDIQRISTIEQAQHWLRKKWPVRDGARQTALADIDAAMECMGSVETARVAFLKAADTAGFRVQA